MRRFRPIISLLLLAFFLPASQHCFLEDAGLFARTCATGECCEQDGCATIKQGASKTATAKMKVSAPSLSVYTCLLCLHLALARQASEDTALSVAASATPDAWVATWYFVRRAAPLPGAPSLALA